MTKKKIRYAVVGLGHISQVAVLPAFAHAGDNSALAALVSGDPEKLRELGRTYRVPRLYSYEDYEACLESGEVDAVYIALPNSMHEDYSVRAARAGVHVLCEKPMAVTERECERMIEAAEDNKVKLMIAYRLHFERANLKAVEVARSGRLGDPRFFTSSFSMQVKEGNIRLKGGLGGGTLYDIGIYCINAARYLFRSEPSEVMAFCANNGEKRFQDVDEMTSAVLRFPEDRLASFTCSFGAADVADYRLVGTKGDLRVESAYEYAEKITSVITVDGESQKEEFSKRDQFAPELLYFSKCILTDAQPEPSGAEGLADVRVIQSLYRSAVLGRPVSLEPFEKRKRPRLAQEIRRPPVRKPKVIHAEGPRGT